MHEKIELRKYQTECIEKCISDFRINKVTRQLVSLPVGSGKTVIFANLINHIQPPTPQATKVLVLAHREELLEQARCQIFKFNNDLTVTIDQGCRNALVATSDVIVASVATLGRKNSARLQNYDKKLFKCIIIDEAHHAVADSYARILTHFENSGIFVLGFSATVRRHDGLSLNGIFDKISYHKDLLEMINDKWLCNLRTIYVKTQIKLPSSEKAPDFSPKILADIVNIDSRNALIVDLFEKYASSRKSVVVFAVNIDHVTALTAAFCDRGVVARALTSKSTQRARIIDDFMKNEIQVLVNCAILTEGTDIPSIDCIIMARPTKSNVLYQQMIGRGLRLHPNKIDCLFIDVVDACKRCTLVTIPTLLGIPPDITLEKCPKNSQVASNEHGDASISVASITEFENPYQLIENNSERLYPFHIFSSNAWVRVTEELFILSWFHFGKTIKIELHCRKDADVLSNFDIFSRETKNVNGRRYDTKPIKVPLECDKTFSLQDVIKAIDSFVSQKYHFAPLRNSEQRQRPATEKTLAYLKKLGFRLEEHASKIITQGAAADSIVRITNGAGKVWKATMRNKPAEEPGRIQKCDDGLIARFDKLGLD